MSRGWLILLPFAFATANLKALMQLVNLCGIFIALLFFSKIAMSGDLISAKTQMVALQNEVTSLRQREAEVSSQLNKVSSEAEKLKNELDRTKDSHSGSTFSLVFLFAATKLEKSFVAELNLTCSK